MIIEFRRHKGVTNPAHIIGFLSQWKMYMEVLPQDADARGFSGQKLDPTAIEKVSASQFQAVFKQFQRREQMSAEQLGQLYELMHATKDVWNSIKED
jgi:Complex1_LYR-like